MRVEFNYPFHIWRMLYRELQSVLFFISENAFHVVSYLTTNLVRILHDIAPIKIEFSLESFWKYQKQFPANKTIVRFHYLNNQIVDIYKLQ